MNTFAFNQVTPLSSYWFGFLIGSNTSIVILPGVEPCFTVVVPIEQTSILESLAAFLRVPFQVKTKKEKCVTLKVISRDLVNQLWLLGLSTSSKSVKNVSMLSSNEFWKGVFDSQSFNRETRVLSGPSKLLAQCISYLRTIKPDAVFSLEGGRLRLPSLKEFFE